MRQPFLVVDLRNGHFGVAAPSDKPGVDLVIEFDHKDFKFASDLAETLNMPVPKEKEKVKR
jgi:hypothetical protein